MFAKFLLPQSHTINEDKTKEGYHMTPFFVVDNSKVI